MSTTGASRVRIWKSKSISPARTENPAAGGWDRLVERGRERYNINCAICHGLTGGGGTGDAAHGMVGRYGMIGIANYHDDRLRKEADGYLFNVITNGKASMAAYGHQVRVQDRWAIVSYIRALQLSQYADAKLVDASRQGGR
jgi:mono/diheme cytochrome c family protein